VIVNQLADIGNIFFENTVGRRVGDHDSGEIVAVFFTLGLQVFHVDIAGFRGSNYDDFHAGHLRGGRIGTVGRGRDHTDITMTLATTFMIGLDCQQSGILALSARIGLQ